MGWCWEQSTQDCWRVSTLHVFWRQMKEGERDLEDIAERREGTCCGPSALCHVSSTMCSVLGSANEGVQASLFASHLFSPPTAANPCENHLVPPITKHFITKCNSHFLPVKGCSAQCISYMFLHNMTSCFKCFNRLDFWHFPQEAIPGFL